MKPLAPHHKLTDEQQQQVCAWLCEGHSGSRVIALVKEHFDIDLTAQTVSYYRHRYGSAIDEAEAEALEAAKREGWGRRTRRVQMLCAWLERLENELQVHAPGPLVKAGLPEDARRTLQELRKELGQERAQAIEHSGPDGGPMVVIQHYEQDNDPDTAA